MKRNHIVALAALLTTIAWTACQGKEEGVDLDLSCELLCDKVRSCSESIPEEAEPCDWIQINDQASCQFRCKSKGEASNTAAECIGCLSETLECSGDAANCDANCQTTDLAGDDAAYAYWNFFCD